MELPNKRVKICFNCHGVGHLSVDCPSEQKSNRCTQCGKAVNKSVVCWDCVTKSHGMDNPEIYIVPRNRPRQAEVISIDSDEDNSSPTKRFKLNSQKVLILQM
jgi:hypothetical protein